MATEDAPLPDLNGASVVSGIDTNIDGSPGNPANDMPGISVSPPGTTADILAELTVSEQARVLGLGGAPSLGVTSSAIDVAALVNVYRNTADIVLPDTAYTDYQFGDATAGEFHIIFRDGDVKFQGNSRGAGVLVVTGKCRFIGNFRFDGVVIVMGDLKMQNNASVYGAVIQKNGTMQMTVDAKIQYSREALDLTQAAMGAGLYLAFNGWQRISQN